MISIKLERIVNYLESQGGKAVIGGINARMNSLINIGLVTVEYQDVVGFIATLAPMVDQPQPLSASDKSAQRFFDAVIDTFMVDDLHDGIIPDGDLPFSDVGQDDEDIKPLPAVTVEPKPTLSNLIDAALDPDNTEAYEALKAYDWSTVPLWVLEIERDDLNAYKWEIWHELRKIPYGVMGSNPEHTAKQLEVDRAFNVMAILNDAMYRYHKGVGFNVLD